MKAVLDNQTKFPTEKVKEGVSWVLKEIEADYETLLVRVKKAGIFRHHGRFYPHAREHYPLVWRDRGRTENLGLPPAVEHLIVVYVPSFPVGRQDRGLRGGPPSVYPTDWFESLICIVAHEAKHFRQFLFEWTRSEVQSEWAEYNLLTKFREEGVS